MTGFWKATPHAAWQDDVAGSARRHEPLSKSANMRVIRDGFGIAPVSNLELICQRAAPHCLDSAAAAGVPSQQHRHADMQEAPRRMATLHLQRQRTSQPMGASVAAENLFVHSLGCCSSARLIGRSPTAYPVPRSRSLMSARASSSGRRPTPPPSPRLTTRTMPLRRPEPISVERLPASVFAHGSMLAKLGVEGGIYKGFGCHSHGNIHECWGSSEAKSSSPLCAVKVEDEYDVYLHKMEATRIGLKTDADYVVTNIDSGLAKAWNAEHAEARIRVGDRIVEVNGIRDNVPKMTAECDKHLMLKIKFAHGNKPQLSPGKYQVLEEAMVTEHASKLSKDICLLDVGTVVTVLEVVTVVDEDRIRGRISEPVGWMSLQDTSDGSQWAEQQEPIPASCVAGTFGDWDVFRGKACWSPKYDEDQTTMATDRSTLGAFSPSSCRSHATSLDTQLSASTMPPSNGASFGSGRLRRSEDVDWRFARGYERHVRSLVRAAQQRSMRIADR